MLCRRFDTFEIDSHELTPEGYLRCWATVARVGVQKYKRMDGTTQTEYRSPEEVGSPESLATYRNRAITIEHPAVDLNSENTEEYISGLTGDDVIFDGRTVKVRLTVTKKDAVEGILNKRRNQFSPGYNAQVSYEPGVSPEGEPYDCTQSAIRVNHIAVTVKARGGSEMVAHLDSADAVAVEHSDLPPATKPLPMAHITISGVQFEASEALAAAFISSSTVSRADSEAALAKATEQVDVITRLTGELGTANATIEAKEGALAGLQSRLDSVQGELDTAKAASPALDQIDQLVAERMELVEKCSKHLDSEFEFIGKSDTELKVAVISALRHDSADVSEKSEVWIDACFETLLDAHQGNSGDRMDAALAKGRRHDSTEDGPQTASDKARARYMERQRKAGQTPA